MNLNYKEITSYLFMLLMLGGALILHLTSSIIAGLIIFLLIKQIYLAINPIATLKYNPEIFKKTLRGDVDDEQIKIIKKQMLHSRLTLIIVVFTLVLLLASLFLGAYYLFQFGNSNLKGLSDQLYHVLQQIKLYLPPSLAEYIPDSIIDMRSELIALFKKHSFNLFEMTSTSLRILVHVLLGIFIGAIVAFHYLEPSIIHAEDKSKLTYYLKSRLRIFSEIFKKVVSSQFKISLINTSLTAIYLLVINPLFSLHIPFAKTLVLLTFLFGLLPVVGNLVTNTAIFLISLTVSFPLAIASLVFLIVIHKLEYYINAKIVGKNITSSIWELLIAMVIMETLFGVIGVIMAPILYGYIKAELRLKSLI